MCRMCDSGESVICTLSHERIDINYDSFLFLFSRLKKGENSVHDLIFQWLPKIAFFRSFFNRFSHSFLFLLDQTGEVNPEQQHRIATPGGPRRWLPSRTTPSSRDAYLYGTGHATRAGSDGSSAQDRGCTRGWFPTCFPTEIEANAPVQCAWKEWHRYVVQHAAVRL